MQVCTVYTGGLLKMCSWCSFNKIIQRPKLWNGSWVQEMVFAFLAISWSVGKAPFNSSHLNRERALIFISNVFFSSYVHIHCSVKTFKTSPQNDFKLYFSLFERFHPTFTPGFCWSGSRVDKSRNPRGSTLVASSQEVSTSFATTIVHHFVFFILETLYPPLLVLMRSLHLVGTFTS